ncbi:WD repeat and HMG-box DNA-binding protein 1 [Eumeta japonica]|uniref:WD repeat and HMG-box DNA-binding protein 1 n=1 Tax=Eumeta variegata TaxID=151549 RepID=A0A4C1VHU4_EUMVA|nr:WD repeat and HMG-box DNA-binding protein 1 [Eumeta japonica]
MKIISKPLRYAHAEGYTDICYTEDGKHIITCGHDGDVRVWLDIEDDDPNSHCVGESASAVCFKENRLYVATDNHAVQAYTFPEFDKDGIVTRFTAPVTQIKTSNKMEIKCAISQCMFSPCGHYLAASTVAGQIIVWEIESGNCVGIIEHPTSHNVSAMAWNPKGNGILAYCDVAGQLGLLENCYGKDSRKLHREQDDSDNVIDQDGDNDAVVDNLIQQYESDDDNAISLEKLKNETLGINMDIDRDDSRPASRQTTVAPAPTTLPPQPPFQPSSTPTHLEHRYMCWNEVGIVRCHMSDNGDSVIDVEFHDTNVHHGLHLNNYLNHTMASLSSTVLVLACETPSKLVCISLLGSSKEWSASLPDTEEILCVAASDGLVGCATNARLLRLFTPMGTQRQVISLAGPVVILASFGSTILSVYHSSEPGISDQHLSMDIIAMHGRQVRTKTIPLPLTPGSRLTWLGTSDAGSPCSYDTAGTLRLYDVASGVWIPMCDMTVHSKGASDAWFIVSVCEATGKVRAILCRGASFPLTAPKPIVTELPLQIPLCELDSEKGQFEEQLVRWAHTTADVDVKAARELALKLFALACRSEIEQRALELMEFLKDDRLLPFAVEYASRLGRMHLADKLSNLAETWQKETDKLNVAQNIHFNELDTQETYDVNNTQDDLNASLILPVKTKEKKIENVNNIKPVSFRSSPGSRNPFKKQQSTTKNIQSPLTLTDRALVEVHSTTDLEEDKENPLKPNTGETFVDWFSRNKTTLESENPEMTPSELTRHCVRMFKTLQSKNSNAAVIVQKRKLEEELSDSTTVTNAPKQTKLSAFAFQSKS